MSYPPPPPPPSGSNPYGAPQGNPYGAPPAQSGYPQGPAPVPTQPGPAPGHGGGATGPVVLDPYSLPSNDNVNHYAFCVDLNGQWFMQKGKMVAYYGNIQFDGLGAGPLDALVGRHFHSPMHAGHWVVAQGQGKLILADRAFDVNSYDLEDGNLNIRSGNLLAFEPGLSLKQSIIPGFLTLIGTGKFVAASNGPVHFVEPPIRVDPQAVVGWADCPSPCHHYDHQYLRGVMGGLRRMTGIGGASGEEHQFEFTGSGQVLMQSSEALMADANVGAVGAAGAEGRGVPGSGPQQGGARRGGGLLGEILG